MKMNVPNQVNEIIVALILVVMNNYDLFAKYQLNKIRQNYSIDERIQTRR